MRIEYTGRQLDVTPVLRGLAERKLSKLERLLPGITRARVTLRADRHRQLAEVTLHSRHLDLSATEARSDLGASLLAALEKLRRQAQRRSGRLRARREARPKPARAAKPRA